MTGRRWCSLFSRSMTVLCWITYIDESFMNFPHDIWKRRAVRRWLLSIGPNVQCKSTYCRFRDWFLYDARQSDRHRWNSDGIYIGPTYDLHPGGFYLPRFLELWAEKNPLLVYCTVSSSTCSTEKIFDQSINRMGDNNSSIARWQMNRWTMLLDTIHSSFF